MDKEALEFRLNQVVYRKVLDESDCNKLNEIYLTRQLDESISVNYDFDYEKQKSSVKNLKQEHIRISSETCLLPDEEIWVHSKLISDLEYINNKFFGLNNIIMSPFNLLQYDLNGKFDWHVDQGITGAFALRRISIVIFLSNPDEYEGGQLEFLPMLKEPIKMEKGYMVAFPSHKLHRVTPVTKGIRRTMVNWISEYREGSSKY